MADLLVLEWESHHLLGVEGPAGGGRLRKCVEIPRPTAEDAPPAADWLKSQLTMAGIRATQTTVILSRDSVVVRKLELPNVPDGELPDLVRFQAASKMSQPLDEILLDFLPLAPREGAVGREVMLASIPKIRIEEVRTACEAAGLELKSIGISPCACAELIARAQPNAEPTDRPELIIAGSAGTRIEISVIAGRQLIFSHVTRQYDSDESSQQAVIAEVTRALVAQGGLQAGQKLGGAWLVGMDVRYPGLAAALEQRLGAPVRVLDPFQLAGGPPADLPAITQRGIFGAPIGAWLAQDRPLVATIDFLNPRKQVVKQDPNRQKLRQRGMAAAVLAVLLIGAYWLQLHWLDQDIETRTKEIAGLAQDIKNGDPLMKSAKEVGAWEKEGVDWLPEMEGLTAQMPPTDRIYLSSWKFEPGLRSAPPKIKVEGFARTRDDIITAKEQLLATQSRYKVEPGGIQPSTKDAYYPWAFVAELLLEPQVVKPKKVATPAPAKTPAKSPAATAAR